MTRWPVFTLALAISACEHGQTPPPGCGNRIIDFGETCDDGNDVADDGCDQCVALGACGNGLVEPEFGEQCDDGNQFSGDGCSAGCFFEGNNQGFLSSLWTFQDLDGTVTGCPTGFPRIDIEAFSQLSGQFLFAFTCADGSGFSQQLPRDLYTVTAQSVSMDASQLFATSLSQQIDLRITDGTFQTVFFNDAGFIEVSWLLRGAQSNNVLNCAQANVETIELSTTPNGALDVLACELGEGVTSVLAAATYTLSITAENAQSQTVGTVTPGNTTVTAPNGITRVTVEIPIAGM